MLDQLSRSYDRQVATATTRLTSIIEPLLIVLLAIMVGFIAFATILPILEISNVV
jgi:type II secretory pathway component PulF